MPEKRKKKPKITATSKKTKKSITRGKKATKKSPTKKSKKKKVLRPEYEKALERSMRRFDKILKELSKL